MSNGTPSAPGRLQGMDVLRTGVIMVGLALVGQFLVVIVMGTPGSGRIHENELIARLFVSLIAIAGPIYWILIRHRGLSWADLGFRPVSGKWIHRSIWIGIATVIGLGIITWFFNKLVGLDQAPSQRDVIGRLELTWFGGITILLYAAVLVPIAEEAFFRGVFYGWLRSRVGIWPAAILTALVFAMLHQFASVFVPILIMGVLLAYLYERTESLWPSIVVHQVFNAISLSAMLYSLSQPSGTG